MIGESPDSAEQSRIPVWATTFGVLLILTAVAGWLNSIADSVHHQIFAARLADAASLEKKGLVEGAMAEFRHALEIRPESAEARLGLARTLVRANRWQEAQQHLNHLREQLPTSGPVHLLAARAAREAGQRNEAAGLYQRAAYGFWPGADAAQQLDARLEWVRFLASTGDRQTLFPELVRLQRDLPVESTARIEIAQLFLDAGHPDESADAFRLSLARDRKSYPLWFGLGQAELSLGRLSEARRAFARASELRIDSAEARDQFNLVTAALGLDPTVRRISRQDREARALRLLGLARERLDSCSAPLSAATRAEATPVLAKTNPTSIEDRIEFAEELWKTSQRLCPPLSQGSSPLPLVFESIARMPQL